MRWPDMPYNSLGHAEPVHLSFSNSRWLLPCNNQQCSSGAVTCLHDLFCLVDVLTLTHKGIWPLKQHKNWHKLGQVSAQRRRGMETP